MPAFERGALDSLRTERLLLVRPREEHRAELLAMHQDPEVMATLGGVRSKADSDVSFDRMVAHWNIHEFGYWVVRDAETDRYVGRGGLSMMVTDGEPIVEVGYGLMSEFWGKGLGTELAMASVRAGFDVVGVRSLACFTMTTNLKSQRVMEKAGFRYEKNFDHAGLEHRFCRLENPSP